MSTEFLDAAGAVEGSGIDGLDICHYDQDADRDSADEFVALLRARGHHRPLVWIYNPRDFGPLLAAFREAGNGFFVYHATENYFTHSESAAGLEQQKIRDLVTKLCSDVDVIIGVSESATANNVIVVIKGAVTVAFILIGGILIAEARWGLRGKAVPDREWASPGPVSCRFSSASSAPRTGRPSF